MLLPRPKRRRSSSKLLSFTARSKTGSRRTILHLRSRGAVVYSSRDSFGSTLRSMGLSSSHLAHSRRSNRNDCTSLKLPITPFERSRFAADAIACSKQATSEIRYVHRDRSHASASRVCQRPQSCRMPLSRITMRRW
jgi:hypothetical protein